MAGMKSGKIIGIGLLALIFSVGAVAITLQINVFQILKEQGPEAALQHSQENLFKNRNFSAVYAHAWATYAKGELVQADALVDRMLYQENWELSDKMKANCFYLKGAIQAKTVHHVEAITYFYRAKELYKKLDNHDNVYRVNLGLAKVYLDMGELSLAETILEESYAIAEEYGLNLGQHYYHYSQLAFRRSNWTGAFDYSERSYVAYTEDNNVNGMANALSDMGFYAMLLGDFELGYEYTMIAQEKIEAIGDTNKHYYNLINIMLYERCHGFGEITASATTDTEREIRERIRKDRDDDLQWYLDFVLTFDCRDIELNLGDDVRPVNKRTDEERAGPNNPAAQPVGDGDLTPPDKIDIKRD